MAANNSWGYIFSLSCSEEEHIFPNPQTKAPSFPLDQVVSRAHSWALTRHWDTVDMQRLPWWLSQQRIHSQCRGSRFHPWAGRSPGEGKGNPLHYSCLGNPMDRGTRWATVYWVTKSQTWLSNWTTAAARVHRPPAKQNRAGDVKAGVGLKGRLVIGIWAHRPHWHKHLSLTWTLQSP